MTTPRPRFTPPRGSRGSWPLLGPVWAYRRFVSPLLPARCRFHPSCSAYAEEALRRHGAGRGLVLAARRIARCHPFNPGGLDPVPSVPPSRSAQT